MFRLSGKDKEWLKEEIRNAVWEALTVEMTWEQRRDVNTGMPLAAPKVTTEDVFLPAFFAQHIKFHEGAFRGFQADANKTHRRVRGTMMANKAIARILMSNERNMEVVARFVVALSETGLLEQLEKITSVEYVEENAKVIDYESDTG